MSGLVAAYDAASRRTAGSPSCGSAATEANRLSNSAKAVSATASRISSSLHPGLPGLLHQMVRRALGGIERRADQREERGLLLVRGGEIASPGDLVGTHPGHARHPGCSVVCRGRLASPPRPPDPLARRPRQPARAKLGAQARVVAEGGGDSARTPRNFETAPGGLDALDQGSTAVRCGELIVDMEAAYVCLDCHLSQYRRFTSSLLYFWPVTYAS